MPSAGAIHSALDAEFGPGATTLSPRWLLFQSTLFYIPPNPTRAILFLHGAGRHSQSLYQIPATRAAIEQSSSLIVFPNGKNSWWLDSAALLGLQQRILRATSIHHWATAGWSMGGYGSLRLITLAPDAFHAWAGLLTLADFPNPAYPPSQNHSVPDLFGPSFTWHRHNPLQNVHLLQRKSLFFLTGLDSYDRQMNESLHRALDQLHIPHTFQLLPGKHEFSVVERGLPTLLTFLAS